ncbi:TPA: hypothetical protein DCG86_06140 [Candidatus Marinimicrobia bacterium]|nr:MAG: hypothetical protein XD77_0258 [Marinimicrobia bacterium 46_47]KUK91765.1 MAG: hypothetical protein XE04_0837 [Marinimicrobia bacterium 46_43]HAE87586.1 hypothetical protein [Candidatus Neomarinimicrobiota bacterium]HBY18154.1 hypothetical protein [Candidatus Neomarinimicrobiota bacterium]
MSISPIQRVSAILILIAVIIWFFNTTLIRNLPEEPLILSGEWIIPSQDPEADAYFFEEVLRMKKVGPVITKGKTSYVFDKGFVIRDGIAGTDTLVMHVSDIDRTWDEILASPARIVAAPEERSGEGKKALFILPGGQITALVER